MRLPATLTLTALLIGCMPFGTTGTGDMLPPLTGQPTLLRLDRAAFLPNETLTLHGAALDPVPGRNRVLFEDLAVVPEAATDTTLTVRVPGGAKSGKLKVEVRGITTGSLPYVVEAPELATLSVTVASPEYALTLYGKNFSPVYAENKVYFNDTPAIPIAGSNGVLLVKVTGKTGPLTVKTGAGTSNAIQFLVIPQVEGGFNP